MFRGTKVTLTVTRETAEPEPLVEPEPAIVEKLVPEPEPQAAEEPPPEPRPRFFARLFRRRPKELVQPESEQPAIIEIEDPEPQDDETPDIAAELKAAEEKVAAEEVTAMLTAVLDRLGAAHHRPFSRA